MQQLRTIFANVLQQPIHAISDETSPRNTESWDSLRHIELVLAVESAFDIRFSTSEMTSLYSLADVRQILHAKGVE